jgi:hypothetical protein
MFNIKKLKKRRLSLLAQNRKYSPFACFSEAPFT